jgi:hypothetical protein
MPIRTEEKSLEWFINAVLIDNMGRMARTEGLQYLSFGAVAVGIELLGACEDEDDFTMEQRSKARFRVGINRYMNQIDARYGLHNSESSQFHLYKFLRCGMAHILRPHGIMFTTENEATNDRTAHLEVNAETGCLVLVAENFHYDFARACHILKSELPNLRKRSVKMHQKLNECFLPLTHF